MAGQRLLLSHRYLTFGRTHNISNRRLAPVSAVFPEEATVTSDSASTRRQKRVTHTCGVIGRRNLHQVTPDQVQTTAASDDLHALNPNTRSSGGFRTQGVGTEVRRVPGWE